MKTTALPYLKNPMTFTRFADRGHTRSLTPGVTLFYGAQRPAIHDRVYWTQHTKNMPGVMRVLLVMAALLLAGCGHWPSPERDQRFYREWQAKQDALHPKSAHDIALKKWADERGLQTGYWVGEGSCRHWMPDPEITVHIVHD